jgi:hypothetical protein
VARILALGDEVVDHGSCGTRTTDQPGLTASVVDEAPANVVGKES